MRHNRSAMDFPRSRQSHQFLGSEAGDWGTAFASNEYRAKPMEKEMADRHKTGLMLFALALLLTGCVVGGMPYIGRHLSPTECRDELMSNVVFARSGLIRRQAVAEPVCC